MIGLRIFVSFVFTSTTRIWCRADPSRDHSRVLWATIKSIVSQRTGSVRDVDLYHRTCPSTRQCWTQLSAAVCAGPFRRARSILRRRPCLRGPSLPSDDKNIWCRSHWNKNSLHRGRPMSRCQPVSIIVRVQSPSLSLPSSSLPSPLLSSCSFPLFPPLEVPPP